MSHLRRTGLSMPPILAGSILVVITLLYAGRNTRGETEFRPADVSGYGQQSSRSIRFFHDPKPEPDIPPEAKHSGTVPLEQNESKEIKSNISVRAALDDKNYGALRNVIHGPLMAIKIRYFNSEAFDPAGAESFLKAVLESPKGDTYTHIFWAEGLGVPEIEAYLHSENLAYPGYLLVWSGRAVYRDPKGKWWFTAMPQMVGKR
jgi:hypothetical protein